MSSEVLELFQRFKEIIKDEHKRKNYLLLSPKNRRLLKLLLEDLMTEVFIAKGYDLEFAKLVINMNDILPLEALWCLQIRELFYLNSYIYFHPDEGTKMPQLLIDLTSLLSSALSHNSDEVNIIKHMYTDFLIELLLACEGPQISNDICDSDAEWSQTSGIIWQSVRRQFLHKLLNDTKTFNVNYLKDIREKRKLNDKIIIKIYLEHLHLIAKHKPYTKVQTAILQQSSWTKNKTDGVVVNTISEILTHIRNPLEELLEIMKQEEISWKWCLSAISICLNVLPETVNLLKKIIDDFLNKAFMHYDTDILLMAFLLARQASYENLPTFESYSSWYSKQFGINSIGPTTKSKAAFEFLIKFLTNIIPSETPEILKIHLEKSLSLPPQCLSIMQEFKTILRTRILDYNSASTSGNKFDEVITID